jgi:hypothetical protein
VVPSAQNGAQRPFEQTSPHAQGGLQLLGWHISVRGLQLSPFGQGPMHLTVPQFLSMPPQATPVQSG